MIPKMNHRHRYASKRMIPLHRSVAMKQGNKPVAGHVMVQTKGQELSQITDEMSEQMIIVIVFIAVFMAFAANYTYKSWILPWRVKHEAHRFEPGRDDEVSAAELCHRSSWRYDSWMDRIMALALDALLVAVLVLILSGK